VHGTCLSICLFILIVTTSLTQRSAVAGHGLSIVHLSAQPKRFLWDALGGTSETDGLG
jgi:hypothetical protein